jgi:hypothetical protein
MAGNVIGMQSQFNADLTSEQLASQEVDTSQLQSPIRAAEHAREHPDSMLSARDTAVLTDSSLQQLLHMEVETSPTQRLSSPTVLSATETTRLTGSFDDASTAASVQTSLLLPAGAGKLTPRTCVQSASSDHDVGCACGRRRVQTALALVSQQRRSISSLGGWWHHRAS